MDLLDPDLLLRDLLHGGIRAVATTLFTRLLAGRKPSTTVTDSTSGRDAPGGNQARSAPPRS